MIRSVRTVADRLAAAVLPQAEAAACYVSYCVDRDCVWLGEPGCSEACTQYCYDSAGHLCYSDGHCV